MKAMEVLLNYLQAVDLGDCLAVMLVLSVPMTLCLLLWFRASCVVTKGRLIVTIALLIVIGWGASCYHRYDIVPVADDELLLKSSDIGDRHLRKINGKWEWQQEKLK